MKRNQVVAITVCLLLLCACAHKLDIMEKQRMTIKETSTLYKALYNSYVVLNNSTAVSVETKAFMKYEVAPLMDGLKDAIIAYNDAVILAQLNGVDNLEIGNLQMKFINAYSKAQIGVQAAMKMGGAK